MRGELASLKQALLIPPNTAPALRSCRRDDDVGEVRRPLAVSGTEAEFVASFADRAVHFGEGAFEDFAVA